MNPGSPTRSKIYRGPVWDSSRWDHFRGREDDVFVCTPSKSGTTWMQTLCALLILGWEDFDTKPSDVSPWFDSVLRPIDEMMSLVEGLEHRRFIKTHTPLDGIPFDAANEYILVYRDPRDVFFSMRNHARNMHMEIRAELLDAPDVRAAFRHWVEAPARDEKIELFSVAALTHHFGSFARFRNLANLHFFHYSDMLRDLPAAVRRLAATLGIDVDEQGVEEISRIARFDNMRANASQFTPNANLALWKRNEDFFSAGRLAQWRDVLLPEDLALYDARISRLVDAPDAAWLHGGGELPARAGEPGEPL